MWNRICGADLVFGEDGNDVLNGDKNDNRIDSGHGTDTNLPNPAP